MNEVTSGAPAPSLERSIAESVLNKVKIFTETGSLDIPKDYSAANAIRVAWLILLDAKTPDKRPVLEVCTKDSIANALLKMVIQGLNPVKRQCSFIAYGNVLTCQKEYAGTIYIAKRDAGVKRVSANAVFVGDEFSFEINPETSDKKIIKHSQSLESMSSMDVKGAYAIVEYIDGSRKTEVMTMVQIRKAWNQGPTKGQSPAHVNFPDQMAIKTVINRALKIDISSSDDSAIIDNRINESGDDGKLVSVNYEIDQNANKKQISIESQQSDKEKNKEDLPVTNFAQEESGPGF